jgi:hypothetical protein
VAGVRQGTGSALGVLVTGVAVFVVASAYIASRELPGWLAGAIGAFAFPLGPIAWHGFAEHRRRARLAAAKKLTTTTLTAVDRLWLRVVAMAIVVIGPMIALGGFDVARAAWHHATWWVPGAKSTALPAELAPLLRRVPPEAELLIVVRAHCFLAQPNGNVVAAWGNGQAAVVGESSLAGKELDTEISSLLRERRYRSYLQFDGLDAVKLDDAVAVASSGWRDGVASGGDGPSDDLRGALARAPRDALFLVAFVPRTIAGVPVRSGSAWMRGDLKRSRWSAEARVEAVNDAAATKLAADARAVLDSVESLPEACRDKLRVVTSAITIDRDGAIVTARAEVAFADLASLLLTGGQACKDSAREEREAREREAREREAREREAREARAADCRKLADHIAQVSTAEMDAPSRERVVAACAAWPETALDCINSARNDDDLRGCQSKVR